MKQEMYFSRNILASLRKPYKNMYFDEKENQLREIQRIQWQYSLRLRLDIK